MLMKVEKEKYRALVGIKHFAEKDENLNPYTKMDADFFILPGEEFKVNHVFESGGNVFILFLGEFEDEYGLKHSHIVLAPSQKLGALPKGSISIEYFGGALHWFHTHHLVVMELYKQHYTQHEGKVIEDKHFKHVMALTLDPTSDYARGVLRCIVSRTGDPGVKGNIDRSELHLVSGNLAHFEVGEKLQLKNAEEIIATLGGDEWDFLGLEDPDIIIDPDTNLTHLYFTMPFRSMDPTKEEGIVHLGHAVGKNLDSLAMTMPAVQGKLSDGAKELSVAPKNKSGVRHNLVESSSIEDGVYYSTVRRADAESLGEPWILGDTLFHPKEGGIRWADGHASPAALFTKDFIDMGEGKMLGLLNGRGANRIVDGKTVYDPFRVGLFIYDYEQGAIDWVSPEPLIEDSEAKNITFASQWVETSTGEGILYAHVDDSFVRAYTLKATDIKSLLP